MLTTHTAWHSLHLNSRATDTLLALPYLALEQSDDVLMLHLGKILTTNPATLYNYWLYKTHIVVIIVIIYYSTL